VGRTTINEKRRGLGDLEIFFIPKSPNPRYFWRRFWMRIAVFSDVHGNLTALDAVLAHIDEQPEIDQVVFAGDLCLFGSQPAECLARIEERGIGAIYGNTDLWIAQPPPAPEEADEAQQEHWRHVEELCHWTAEQLGDMGLAWFRVLPFHRRASPTVFAQDDLLIVHANPVDVNQVIFPSEADQRQRYGRVRQPDSELGPLLQDTLIGVLAYGHLHIPGVRRWQNLTLVNVSSVSLPGDGDPRAKYAVFTWQAAGWSFEHHYVDYSIEAEIQAYQTAQPPRWETAVAKLKENSAISRKL
jgi:predicted phosphodiesterase